MSALGVILTIFIVVLIIMIVRYMFYSSNVLTSIANGKTASTINASQLPNNATGSAPTNFTYSMWVFIDNWSYRYGQPKIILGRMGGSSSSSGASGIQGIYGADPCPVIALGAVENTVTCALSCYGGLQDTGSNSTDASHNTVHTCMIANVPLQSWVHLAVVVNNTVLDFYMNGKQVRTCLLPGTAKVDSSAPLQITPGGGFEGYTANIQYFPAAKNQQEIWNIYEKGYKSNIFGNLFNTYSLQVSVTENGVTQGSVTL